MTRGRFPARAGSRPVAQLERSSSLAAGALSTAGSSHAPAVALSSGAASGSGPLRWAFRRARSCTGSSAQGGDPFDMQSDALRRSEAGEECHSGAWRRDRRKPSRCTQALPLEAASASERSEHRAARDAKRRQPLRARSRLSGRILTAHHRAPVGRRRSRRRRKAAGAGICLHQRGKSPHQLPGKPEGVAASDCLRTRMRARSNRVPRAASHCERGA